MPWLTILSRWIHVVSACIALGGTFFIVVVLPVGFKILPPDLATEAHQKIRRVFKMVMHSTILLLLLSGIFNTIAAWGKYKLDPRLLHPLWGTHVLFGLIAMSIAFWVLAGRTPRKGNRMWLALNLLVLLATVAAASTLKWARDSATAAPNATNGSTAP
jgi:uncharacterized membrane protein